MSERAETARVLAMTAMLDELAAAVCGQFSQAGIDVILLKGPSIAQWLYPDGLRAYGDVDVLVAPDRHIDAERVLAAMGFRDSGSAWSRQTHATSWTVPGRGTVELHRRIVGIAAPSHEAWPVLRAHTASLKIAGTTVRTLDFAPRLVHLALHAAQHGPHEEKPRRELAYAVASLPIENWRAAAAMAEPLGARGALRAGLELVHGGVELVNVLGLNDADPPFEIVLRAKGLPLHAMRVEEIRTARGTRHKLAVIRRELFPSREELVAWHAPARHPLGAATAYVVRPFWVLVHAPSAVKAWRLAGRRHG